MWNLMINYSTENKDGQSADNAASLTHTFNITWVNSLIKDNRKFFHFQSAWK